MLRYNLEVTARWHDRKQCIRSFKHLDIADNFVNLAKAGFFYHEDSIYCFSCFLKIDDWLNLRNPIVTHCLKSTNCKFVLRYFGPEGVQDVLNNYAKNFDKNTFICSVCKINYIDRFLICGHCYCSNCLKQLQNLNIEKTNPTQLKCPSCRANIIDYNETMGPGINPENN